MRALPQNASTAPKCERSLSLAFALTTCAYVCSIGDKGAIAIAEGLKVNAVLTSLK